MKNVSLQQSGGMSAVSDGNDEKQRATRKFKSKVVSKDERERMFASTIDPYDRPLKWWEREHVKYAYDDFCNASIYAKLFNNCRVASIYLIYSFTYGSLLLSIIIEIYHDVAVNA